MPKNRKLEVQKLLAHAQTLVDRATEICKEDEIDGVSFMGKTFRCYRNGYNGIPGRIAQIGWYTDDYWCSSDADCEIWIVDEVEKEE